MPSITHLLAFIGVAVVLVAMPGPSVLFVVGRALADGRRTAVLGAIGNEIGEFALAAAVALGAGVLVERSAALFTGLKIVGAVYLVYLGVRALRRRSQRAANEEADGATQAEATPEQQRQRTRRAVLDGVTVGFFNPKTAIFLTALLPQFVQRGHGNATVQMLVLAFIWTLTALITDVSWALLAGTTRDWFARSPKRMSAVERIGGISMIGVGVTLALAGRAG